MKEDYTLIHNPQEVERLSRQKEEATLVFLQTLKSKHRSKEINETVHLLNNDVSALIDCTACANCCKVLNPAFTDNDIGIIAQHTGQSPESFSEKHLLYNETENYGVMKRRPCDFLKDNKCTIYNIRPESCREYPHLNRPNFIYRIRSTMNNYKMCPIVYNVVEQLKEKFS